MAYPSTLSTYTDPSPTDRLSTTPHSSIETAQNTGLREIQAFIGTLSSTAGTLIYDIRASASNGGGHVQTANKGGTGQTTFTKGDILVATSSSVLSKLAVSGNDNDFLAVNSSTAAGINWIAGVTSGQVQNFSFNHAGKDSGTGSVYAIYPVPCVLSLSDGQVFTFRAATANTVVAPALSVSSLVSKLIKNPDGSALYVGQIAASMQTMVQYNGTQSFFGILSEKNGNALTTIKSSVIGYAGDTASGTQSFTHGLSKTPTFLRISALKNYSAGANVGLAMSNGSYDGTNTNCEFVCIGVQGTSGGAAASGNNTNIIVIQDASSSAQQVATVSMDTSSVLLTWTKTGSPSSGNIAIKYEVEG